MKLTDQVTGHENTRNEIAGRENPGHENAGHEFAIHDKYRMKIYYITVQCAFLLNFKSCMYGECVNAENLNIAVFPNLYTLYCIKLFAAATNFNRFVVNVAY